MSANADYPIVEYSRLFVKQLKKAPLPIKESFRKRRELFLKDPHHPLLRNHVLSGGLKGLQSMNVTGDWRALYSEHKDSDGQKFIVFEMLGTHSQLYK